MHRATRLMLGTVGIGLLAAFLVLGISGSAAMHSTSGSSARDGGTSLVAGHTTPAAAVHPDPALNTTVGATITGVPNEYSTLPAWVNFTVYWGNVTGFTINSVNTQVTLQVVDITSHTNQSLYSVPIVTGQASYAITLDQATMNCAYSDITCTNTLVDSYTFNVWTALNGTGYGGTPASNENQSGTFTTFITYAPSWILVSPTTTSVVAGNITVSVAYQAQLVTAVNLNIYSGTTLVYSSSFLQSSPGISVAKVWYEGTAGTYNVSIQGVTVYQTFYQNSTLTVTAVNVVGGGTVYENTTLYTNTTAGSSPTGYFGLSPPASGTMLLLIGLIVGILVALVAARMMMSQPPSKPAQAWEQKTGDANTCSVCGKSFGSADELSAHAKSEHGMQ